MKVIAHHGAAITMLPFGLQTQNEDLIVAEGYVASRMQLFAAAFLVAVGGAGISKAEAAPQDYRFEIAGQPALSGGRDIVPVRLVHAADGKPVIDAVIYESTADMGPMGMAAMAAPVKALPAQDEIYRFEVDPGTAAGTWALHLAAKVQGETETVRGTVDADLVVGAQKKPGGTGSR
ncbi:MAG: FixH family protein [Aliidongia sp.]